MWFARQWRVLFDILTSKSGPTLVRFVYFELGICFPPLLSFRSSFFSASSLLCFSSVYIIGSLTSQFSSVNILNLIFLIIIIFCRDEIFCIFVFVYYGIFYIFAVAPFRDFCKLNNSEFNKGKGLKYFLRYISTENIIFACCRSPGGVILGNQIFRYLDQG
jgi:hypothetical protein